MKILKSEMFWLGFFSVALYILAYFPVLENYRNKPSDRVYLGFTASPIDTLGHLTGIERGIMGYWLMDSYITTAIPGNWFFVKTIYYLAGHIARIIRLDAVTIYKLLTLFLSVIYLFTVWALVRYVFKNKNRRIMAFGLILFSAGIIIPGSGTGWETIGSDMQVFQRMVNFEPHYMLAAITIIWTLIFTSRYFESKNPKWIFLSLFTILISSHSFFPPAIIFILGLAIYFVIKFIITRQLKQTLNEMLRTLFIAISGLIPIIYLWYSSRFYDMNTMVRSENLVPARFGLWDYFFLVGPVTIASIIAIPVILKKSETLTLMTLSLAIVHPLAVVCFSGKIGVNQLRFLQTPYFVYLGILSVFGFEFILKIIRPKRLKFIISVVIGILMVIPSLETYKQSFLYPQKFRYFDNLDFGYPKYDDYEAYRFIKNTYKDRIILSKMTSGTSLMALTPNRAYVSSWIGSQLGETTQILLILTGVSNFFSGKMKDNDACMYLKDNNISLVYFGQQEKNTNTWSGGSGKLTYKCLKSVFGNGTVEIYSFD